MSHTTDL